MNEARTYPSTRLAAIARSGTLSVGLFPSFFYTRDPAGKLSGWAIEMARELATRHGAELQLVERDSPPAVVEALRAGRCDIAFMGISPQRAGEVEFTPPWAKGEFTFLVPAGSAARAISDLDADGLRIAVVRDHAMDGALAGKVVKAGRVYAVTPDAAFALFAQGRVDALAGIRPGLVEYCRKAPGSRVLPDAYGANVIGLAVPKGDPDWLAAVSRFVADTKSSGSARAAAERVGAAGLDILP
jgi:polar amino acid transport system substrate-binding protein